MAGEVVLGTGEIAGIVTATVGGLALFGRGLVWLFTARGKRELWVDEAVKRHMAGLTARVATLEREKAIMARGLAVAMEVVQRFDPTAPELREIHRYLLLAFPAVLSATPENIADLVAELRAKEGMTDDR